MARVNGYADCQPWPKESTYLNTILTSNSVTSKVARPHMAGALAVYCGGCAIYVGPEGIRSVGEQLREAIPDVPFFGNFTFGEQGMSPDRKAFHGNLMFSILVFTRRRLLAKVLNVDTGELSTEGDLNFLGSAQTRASQVEGHTLRIREAGATIMNRHNLVLPLPTQKGKVSIEQHGRNSGLGIGVARSGQEALM